MAERRMFSKSLIHGSTFTDLPKAAQLLYFHMGLSCDDDGVCGNASVVCRMARTSQQSLQTLIDTGWVLDLGDGVVAMTHWRVHNNIRSDRYKPTLHQTAFARIRKNVDNVYIFAPTDTHTPVYQRDTQYR